MLKVLTLLGCILLAVLIAPVFVRPPARDSAESKQVELIAEHVQKALEAYHAHYGEAPEGDQAEIIAALRGDNEEQMVFLDVPDELVNDAGELVDPWGTPYRIRFDEKYRKALVHSAGLDRKFQQPGERCDDYFSSRGGGKKGIPGLPF